MAVLAPIPRTAVWERGVGCIKVDQHLFFNFFFKLYTFTNHSKFVYFTYYLMKFYNLCMLKSEDVNIEGHFVMRVFKYLDIKILRKFPFGIFC